jgi:predicted AAA+ superfamily ATPase
VISIYENKEYTFDIYLTGSNSKMFSQEISSIFTGRNLEIAVNPLTFNEIFKNKETYSNDLKKYIVYGGLGLIIKEYEDNFIVDSVLNALYRNTLEKDIKTRHKIRNNLMLSKILQYLFENIGKTISASKMEEFLKMNSFLISKKTILNYFS